MQPVHAGVVKPRTPEAAEHWRAHRSASAKAEVVEVPAIERKRLREIAERIRTNKRAAYGDGTWDNRGFTRRNYIGLCGVWAAAKVLDLPADEGLYAGSDPGYDISWADCRVDVKTLQGWLAFTTREAFKAEWAVLVNPIPGTYRLSVVGGIVRQAFMDGAFEADFGYGVRWCLTSGLLNPQALREAMRLHWRL